MLLTIKNLIKPTDLAIMRQALQQSPMLDGKTSAGKIASQVKYNKELDLNSAVSRDLAKILVGHLYAKLEFVDAALPHKIAQPVFARYTEGMEYGAHIDDPIMGDGPRFRCDLAVTVFLNAATEYDGGELVINTTFGEQQVKLDAGDLVLYPASSVHRVTRVTRGERWVGVTWIQSMIRDASQREILFNLSQARNRLLFDSKDQESARQVDQAYVNLVRLWAEV